MIRYLKEVFIQHADRDAIVWNNRVFCYAWLTDRQRFWHERLQSENIQPGTVVALDADFTPNAIALFFALAEHQCTIVPLTASISTSREELMRVAGVDVSIRIDASDNAQFDQPGLGNDHPIYSKLRESGHPGLVIFSSGSTGTCKAAVHDLMKILDKFRTPRHTLRSIAFLLFDHIGGLNTMLYQLSNAGCLITIADRLPDTVLRAVAQHRADLLPASPTFLRLMLLSGALERHDLTSLKTVTYGTEPMPETTLRLLHAALPGVRLLQTYGLSELGILRSKSLRSDSLWVKIGGDGFETRIVDQILQVKAQSTMLGYINEASPLAADGWYNTGDVVEQNGEYIRFLGRQSDVINVGGEKVYPAEVESVIQEVDGVLEVCVYGEENTIVGNVVCARVSIRENYDSREVVRTVGKHCRKKMARYKVPARIVVASEIGFTSRGKKVRKVNHA